ncbi:Fic family protein [Roseateles sp.]|uniref:Fic family protein n=1 Tax=Roseateles sp. TaxID=1971397 RepID=UPI0025ECC5C1|nr:Fic family protein [Roseateles sp.]MBV8034175.1 Fic family protein [Roseateles sp.]
MDAQKILQYDQPHQFEPLMPRQEQLEPLLELASDLTRAATALGTQTGPNVHGDLRALLRSMNSYYTNRIEGEHTRPADIERALQQDFSANADVARKQRLAVAHIETEKHCEEQLGAVSAEAVQSLYSEEALKWLHERLFAGLRPEDLTLSDGSQMVPGQVRERQVAVGRHEAPAFGAVPRFIERWGQVYGRTRRGEATVVAAMASHHRLAWIHPFLDGNGRVARLHTHLVLHAAGLTHGLWSPLRGFARTETKYKALLQAADEHRRGDLDGRGNLTEAGLIEWTTYALEMCIDQADFMASMLNVEGMQGRIEAALTYEESVMKAGVRREALKPLHYLFATQTELARADFKTMTGLGDRVATDLLSSLLKQGYLNTDSAYGKVRFAIPRRALQFYFPDLWPEAQKDAEPEAAHAEMAPALFGRTRSKT